MHHQYSILSYPLLFYLLCHFSNSIRCCTFAFHYSSIQDIGMESVNSRCHRQNNHIYNHFHRIVPPVTKVRAVVQPTNHRRLFSVYPTARGAEVDARKIVSRTHQHLQALLVSHCLFLTQPLAEESFLLLRTAKIDFEQLATTASACTITRQDHGLVGWINIVPRNNVNNTDNHQNATKYSVNSPMTEPFDTNDHVMNNNNNNSDDDEEDQQDTNSHLDEILPPDLRKTLVSLVTKPGDIVMLESWRGIHLIQIRDVMVNVPAMATLRKQRKSRTYAYNTIESESLDQLTYKIETMGCQMNLADSERMEGQLLQLGITPVADNADPDIVLLNTCSIRDHAEQKVYSYLGPYVKRKRQGSSNDNNNNNQPTSPVTLIVAGCVAQQEGEALLRRIPEIDLVLGPQYANRLGDLLIDVRYHGNQVVATAASHIMEDSTKPRRMSTVSAWVNVIYGCNERCTFCIVPTTRGVEQSRPVESIVREVTQLVQHEGYREITLLGQNIDAYGRDMMPKRKFSDLIRIVGNISGLERLRFVTSHPRYMSMGVVDAVAETATACECFHIPFQSGSNTILAAMGRGHTREKYLYIVDRIRNKIPDAAITADVIVGFPGETEDDFQQTLNLMKEVVFDSIHTAAYSPRPNTPAANWTNQIPESVKQERLQRINALNLHHATIRRSRMLGRTVPVLVEERNVKVPTQVTGRTRHGYIVYCDGDIETLRGKTVNVKIDTTETYYLAGKRIPE